MNTKIITRNAQILRDQSRWTSPTRELLQTQLPWFMDRFYVTYERCAQEGEFDYLETFVDSSAASIDVGANMGIYSLRLAAISKTCLSIEPIPEYKVLQDFLPGNCRFYNVAAGAVDGNALLRTPQGHDALHWGLSTLDQDKAFDGMVCIRESEVAVRALDDIVSEALPNERIGFIKIDTEGYELQVLQGASKTIAEHRPNLQIEIDDSDMAMIRSIFAEYEYGGCFFYDGRMLDISQFQPHIHQAPENRWTIETAHKFNRDLWVCNFFFFPLRRR